MHACMRVCVCVHYVFTVELGITFSILMYITCVTFVQRFESQGKHFTNYQYYNRQ